MHAARPAGPPPPRAQAAGPAAAVLAAAVLAAFALAGCGGTAAPTTTTAPATSAGAQQFEGAALPGEPAPPFALTDIDGAPVSLASYRGRVTVLAFLQAGCRACTLIAQQLRGALDELGSAAPPVLIVSVEPAHDTPARVAAFLHSVSLSGRALWLTGPPAGLAAIWRAYRVRTPAQGQAAFELAAPVYLIDAQGRERVIYEQEQLTPEGLAHDIARLQGRPDGG
jgi:protein SCO1